MAVTFLQTLEIDSMASFRAGGRDAIGDTRRFFFYPVMTKRRSQQCLCVVFLLLFCFQPRPAHHGHVASRWQLPAQRLHPECYSDFTDTEIMFHNTQSVTN